jgi:LPS-assembly lipoprotein
MSSPDRRRFLALAVAAAALGGCGLQPAHGPGPASGTAAVGAAAGTGTALRGAVLVDPPAGGDAFALVRRLEGRLGRPREPRFALAVEAGFESEGLAITRQSQITRYNLVGEARYTLTELGTGALRDSGTVRSFTSYSATGSTVATLAAERDARERLMVILADRIVARLLAAAPTVPGAAGALPAPPGPAGP